MPDQDDQEEKHTQESRDREDEENSHGGAPAHLRPKPERAPTTPATPIRSAIHSRMFDDETRPPASPATKKKRATRAIEASNPQRSRTSSVGARPGSRPLDREAHVSEAPGDTPICEFHDSRVSNVGKLRVTCLPALAQLA
jgi:hypothetical protein